VEKFDGSAMVRMTDRQKAFSWLWRQMLLCDKNEHGKAALDPIIWGGAGQLNL